MCLADIDAELSRQADWRAAAAAPCVRLSRAALPRAPLSPADIDAQVAGRFERFVDDDTRFIIDVQERRILVPPVLWQFRAKLIDEYHRTYGTDGATLTTALLAHLRGSAARRLQDAVGYASVEAPPGGKLACLRHL
jgi:hypothetical protein